VAEPQRAAVEERAADAVDAVGLARMHGDGQELLREVVERITHPAGRESGLGARDVEADDAVGAVAHRELGDLESAVGVAHRAHELADPDVVASRLGIRDARLEALLNGLDGLVEGESAREVLLRCPADLAPHDAIGGEVVDELARDALEPLLGLHDRRRDVEGLEVFDERAAVRLLGEPLAQHRRVGGRQIEADPVGELDDGLRSQTAVEVVVEGDLRQRRDVGATSGQDEFRGWRVHASNLLALRSMPSRIILDCDPGHDDAVALLLAHGSPEIELMAVTTVMGNQTIDKVTRNALAVAKVIGLTGVPFAKGAHRPLVRQIEVAESIHGESGLDGPVLPEPDIELDPRHAVDLIIDLVMGNEPGTITLVPTGALTNIALAVRKEPRIASRVKEVVLMGGGFHTGNWSATSEFNIVIDPEAAHIVFNESWPLTMVGLDVTHEALATPEVVASIAAVRTAPARFVGELLEFFAHTYKDQQGFDHPPVHDPCAVAFVIDRTVMETRRVPLDVELTGSLTLGMTVADFRSPAPDDCTTQVAMNLDHAKFWGLVVDALERIGDPAT
jgi:purine nucleosidase